MTKFLSIFTLLLAVSVQAQILSTNRTPAGQGNWAGLAGVQGGIPTVSTIYKTESVGASASTVQTDINACPSNQVVYLPAGTYNWSSTVQINRNGVVLRGAGSNTIVNFSSGYLYIGDQNWYTDFATPQSSRHKNWTYNVSQGATTIGISAIGDLAVGEIVMLDQLNDSDVDYVGHCSGPVSGLYSSVSNPNVGNDRWQYQVNRVTAISGTNITLANPVYAPFFSTGQTPQAWWYNAQPWQRSGVENLTLNGAGGSSQGIYFQNVANCWATNVLVTNCRYGISSFFACNCSIVHCSVTLPSLASDSYNFQLITSSGLLVENNISVGGTLMMNGVSGSVISYNYLRGTTGSTGYMQGGLLTHGANPNMNLYEGNYAPGVWWENCWGSSEYITAFRNRLFGNDENPNSGVSINNDKEAINANQYQRYHSVIGNLLGNAASTGYEDSGTSYTCHSTTGRIYYLGEIAPGSSYTDCGSAYDSLVVSTMTRAMNWDTVTSTNGGIVSGGYTSASVSNSLYYVSKPAFFGNLNFPAYDTSSTSSAALDKTNIPAGYRYVYGIDPPTGTATNQLVATGASGSGYYNVGDTPSVVASGQANSYFTNWLDHGGVLANTNNSSTTATIYATNGIIYVTANYVTTNVNHAYTVVGGSGSQAAIPSGTSVTAVSTGQANSYFTNWIDPLGVLANTNLASASGTMVGSDATVTANYVSTNAPSNLRLYLTPQGRVTGLR